MKTILSSLLIIIGLMLSHSTAWSKLNTQFSADIETACKKSSVNALKDKVKKESVCACIAKTHFSAAQKEPKESDAVKQLQWVVDYYQITDPKKMKTHSDKDENLVDYDFMVVEDCLRIK